MINNATHCCFFCGIGIINISKKLAPWCVLGIDKCAALTRAAAKHTPRKGNKNNEESQSERRGGAEPSPLNRLWIGCRFSAERSFLFIGFAVMFTS